MRRFRPYVLLVLLAPGCGDSVVYSTPDGGDPCVDPDGDGYGVGCAPGPDCDETSTAIHTDCAVCLETIAVGCPCVPGYDLEVTCYDGDVAATAFAPCAKGVRACSDETATWGLCLGQVLPTEEYCDTLDNDCDGTVNEGVLNTCGDCTPGCSMVPIGGPGERVPMPGDVIMPPNVTEVDTDGVGPTPSGDIILDQSTFEDHFLWVANSAAGTVSKLDTLTGAEVARYATVVHDARLRNPEGKTDISAATFPPWGGAHSPSRTAIDFLSDVWVGNRAFGYYPSATKIINNVERCTDLDGDLTLETSWDANGDGVINPSDPLEFFGEADECIAVTVIIGNVNGLARAVAVDAGDGSAEHPGNAWIGIYSDQAFYRIDGLDPSVITRVPPTGPFSAVPSVGRAINPYGTAIDGDGTLWVSNGCCGAGGLVPVDTTTSPPTIGAYIPISGTSCGGQYGIAVDLAGRVWLGGWPCPDAFRYDPATGTWLEASLPAGWETYGGRGIGADMLGNIWMAIHQNWAEGAIARFDAATGACTGVWDVVGDIPVGAAADFQGNVWTVNNATANASKISVDPTTGDVTGVATFPVGSGPYTYSDFTGLGLRTVTRSSGSYSIVFEGCEDNQMAHWESLAWEATLPPETMIRVGVQTSADGVTFSTALQYWDVSPADLQIFPGPAPDSRFLKLNFTLQTSDREATPILQGFDLRWTCPIIPID